MAIYEVLKAGDEILRQKSVAVTEINDTVRRLLDDMAETMYYYDGCGLAAPQIGILKRIILVDIGTGLWELINPEIVAAKGKDLDEEGCLSIPGYYAPVERYKKVKVRGLDRNGKEVLFEASDMAARAFQHEIDHLDGILFTDKIKEKG